MKTTPITSRLAALLSRRSILRYLAAGVGAGSLGFVGCRRSDPAKLVAPLHELARHPESLAAIGEAFLEEYPRENLETITEWLAAKLDWHESMPADELARRLAELVRTDFRDSKTRRVSHWILSETEVRWAAVVALTPPGIRVVIRTRSVDEPLDHSRRRTQLCAIPGSRKAAQRDRWESSPAAG